VKDLEALVVEGFKEIYGKAKQSEVLTQIKHIPCRMPFGHQNNHVSKVIKVRTSVPL
jgi:hypothetical protein